MIDKFITQLSSIMPGVDDRARTYAPYLLDAMEEFEIDTRLRMAAFLANVHVESGGLRYVREIASGKAYDGRKDLGNTFPDAIAIAKRHGTTPGPWWRGHGLIQITGYLNHKRCGEALKLDLLNHPDLLQLPRPACRSSAWFWWENNLNHWADTGDFDGTRDVINRGHKTKKVGDANGYDVAFAAYRRALDVL